MIVADVLIAARKKIEREECWTRGATGRDRNGVIVLAEKVDAVCWCAVGAAWAVVPSGPYAAIDVLHLCRPAGFDSVADFNDAESTTHADVLALFDRAIQLAKEQTP